MFLCNLLANVVTFIAVIQFILLCVSHRTYSWKYALHDSQIQLHNSQMRHEQITTLQIYLVSVSKLPQEEQISLHKQRKSLHVCFSLFCLSDLLYFTLAMYCVHSYHSCIVLWNMGMLRVGDAAKITLMWFCFREFKLTLWIMMCAINSVLYAPHLHYRLLLVTFTQALQA